MKENVFYVAPPLEEESIVSLYDNVAKEMGIDPELCTYDCTKIEVSPERETIIRKYYKTKRLTNYEISMNWLLFGPKVNTSLIKDVVKIDFRFFEIREN